MNEQLSAECDAHRFHIHINIKCKPVEKSLADLENTETWEKLHGYGIVAGERLQEMINKTVTCCFCQESVELVENLESKNRLGSIWMFQCQNESCLS